MLRMAEWGRTARGSALALGLALGALGVLGAASLAGAKGLRQPSAADSTLLVRADTAYAHQDWAQAAKGYDAFTRRFAAAGRTWYRLGLARGSLEHWPEAIAAYRAADSLGSPPQFAAYNMACAFARAGLADSAFAVLGRAADRGWGNPQALDQDADLAPLRADARFAALRGRAEGNRYPCKARPESRVFDFWVGDWAVYDNQHSHGLAGHSHVERILGDCVIFENWSGGMGGTGKSFNAYNAETGTWQQNWMDDSGTVTNFVEGRFADGHLSFLAHKKDPQGRPCLDRLTFFDLGPDRVRQFSELSYDEGKTWVVGYDFDYQRVKDAVGINQHP